MGVFDLSPELVSAAQLGDPVARDQLTEACLPLVLRWSMRLCPSGVDPEDVAHDALVRALTALPSLRDPARFPAWLYRTVVNTMNAHRRRAWLRKWVPGLEPEQPVDEAPSGPRDSMLIRRVREAIQALPDAQREVLILCEVEGYTSDQVSEILEIPQGTVKSRLRLARGRFAREAHRRGLDPVVEHHIARGSR